MEKTDVRIVKLEPMCVVSFHGYGAGPELVAASKLEAWLKANKLTDELKDHRIFGFNNPDPSPGSPNYGYEFWFTIKPAFKAEKGATVKEFSGGLYGVTRVNGVENITPTWKRLAAWRAQSSYQAIENQWLEEHIGGIPITEDNLTLDLYIPIKE